MACWRGGSLSFVSARCILSAALAAVIVWAAPAFAQTSTRGETYAITRAKGPIVIDGNLSDEGWRGAVRIERWYEINPGDNIEPPVKNVGYLTYDDKFFYAAFEFEDPKPRLIMAPYGDHAQRRPHGLRVSGLGAQYPV
jgi:hypothetical protein